MRHGLTNAAFSRTTVTTCDVFVMAVSFLESKGGSITPEQLIECVSPWFIDAETVWWRKLTMDVR
jgi:hypothetical protein